MTFSLFFFTIMSDTVTLNVGGQPTAVDRKTLEHSISSGNYLAVRDGSPMQKMMAWHTATPAKQAKFRALGYKPPNPDDVKYDTSVPKNASLEQREDYVRKMSKEEFENRKNLYRNEYRNMTGGKNKSGNNQSNQNGGGGGMASSNGGRVGSTEQDLNMVAKKVPTPPKNTRKALTIVEQGPGGAAGRVSAYKQSDQIDTTSYSHTISKYSDDLMKSFVEMNHAIENKKGKLKDLLKKGKGLFGKLKGFLEKMKPSNLLKSFEDKFLGGRSLKGIIKTVTSTVKDARQMYKDFKQNGLGALAKYTEGLNIGGFNIGAMVAEGAMLYNDGRRMYQIVKNGDWKSVTGILENLNGLGMGPIGQMLSPIIDFQATSAFIGGFFKDIADSGILGIPGMVKEFKNMFKNNSREFRAAAAVGLINAATRGDMGTMQEILNLSSLLGDKSRIPLAIKTILANYKLDPLYSPRDAKQYQRELYTLLGRIEKNWWLDKSGNANNSGMQVTKLEYFTQVSKDAQLLLSMGGNFPSFQQELMIASSYQSQNIIRLVEASIKEVVIERKRLADDNPGKAPYKITRDNNIV